MSFCVCVWFFVDCTENRVFAREVERRAFSAPRSNTDTGNADTKTARTAFAEHAEIRLQKKPFYLAIFEYVFIR